jgi:putative ABC transport system permease protein
MKFKYVIADLTRNPRRTLSTIIGVILGIALTCAILFFVDGLSASMTQQATINLPIDMQRVVTIKSDDIILNQSINSSGLVTSGDLIEVKLLIKNTGINPANEVVIRSIYDSKFKYLKGSAKINGDVINSEIENPFSKGAAKTGWNIGTLNPNTELEINYIVESINEVNVSSKDFKSTFSTRELIVPIVANKAASMDINDIVKEIKSIEGIVYAEKLFIGDLSPGSLIKENSIEGPIRIFGFDSSFTEQDNAIKIIKGSQKIGEVMISVEVAEKSSLDIGDVIIVQLFDKSNISKRISGIVDLSQARLLFSSRSATDLETFIYIPNVVIFDTQFFSQEILPSYERAISTRGDRVKNQLIQEIELGVNKELLNAEPKIALEQTHNIAKLINGIGDKEDYLIDHISNTLKVASDDAQIAKMMFVFLGVPGVILAALIAAYAGIVLSHSQRREQANLRIRGASRKHLLSMLTIRVSLITATGAGIGVIIGFITSALVIGLSTILRVTELSLLISASIGTISGLLATGIALYITGQRSIDKEINEERAKLYSGPLVWEKYWFDLIGIIIVIVSTIIVILNSGFQGVPGSVYQGRAVHLNLVLLILPILFWICGSLFLGRVSTLILSKIKSSVKFKNPFSLIFRQSIIKRSRAISEAAIIICLIIAFGTSLAIFTDSYQTAKDADARYIIGSDIRITPSPTSINTYKNLDSSKFMYKGVDSATAVVYGIHNTILRSTRTSELSTLGAINPEEYLRITPVDNKHFSSGSAKNSINKLSEKPEGILLSFDMADFLEVKKGENIYVLLSRGTSEQVEIKMNVVDLFEKLPGFPDGIDALINIDVHEKMVNSTSPDFFLLSSINTSNNNLNQLTKTIREEVASKDSLTVETRLDAKAKDQSSLAALNIDGLLKIDSAFALTMGLVTIAIFVFGLLLSRRREYVTLRALGLRSRQIRTIIGAEAGTAAIFGSIMGIFVGLGMAYFFINILRPLFVLNPPFIVPLNSILILVGSVLLTTVLTSIVASALINKLSATELLRDE